MPCGAYSKLTLSLRVLGVRDDGYHEIEALTISIGQPHDVVEVSAVPHPGGVTFSDPSPSTKSLGVSSS